jgi:hypothetical protein
MNSNDDPASEGKEAQMGPAPMVIEREDFWAETCREMTQMQHASPEVVLLYRQHGCRFCAPGRLQVQHVLQALDSAAPGWEKQHPELFYQTLELNFPELVRHK